MQTILPTIVNKDSPLCKFITQKYQLILVKHYVIEFPLEDVSFNLCWKFIQLKVSIWMVLYTILRLLDYLSAVQNDLNTLGYDVLNNRLWAEPVASLPAILEA